jgi:biopolymer transport protein ExbD
MTAMTNKARARRRAVVDDLPVADINTTPLIDVMLVLLVMIIITIPVQLHAVNLHLPVGDPPPADHKPEVVQIAIAPAGALYDAFAAVMVAVNQAGLTKVGVTGSEQFIPK